MSQDDAGGGPAGGAGFWLLGAHQATGRALISAKEQQLQQQEDAEFDFGNLEDLFPGAIDDDEAALNLNDFAALVAPAPVAPLAPLVAPRLSVPTLAGRPRLTRAQEAKAYRARVAIPRYLAKRARRNWDQRPLMHPTRSVAALRRARNGGQFRAVPDTFKPVATAAQGVGSKVSA